MADYTLPDDRAYTSEHIWLLENEDGFTLGISDFAQAQLEEVVYVDMPAVGDQLEAEILPEGAQLHCPSQWIE